MQNNEALYKDLFVKACFRQVTVPCPRAKAKNLRSVLYKYRQSLLDTRGEEAFCVLAFGVVLRVQNEALIAGPMEGDAPLTYLAAALEQNQHAVQ